MTSETPAARPAITITYCRQCHFRPRAMWVAEELLHSFEDYVSGVTLVPGSGGQFDVRLDGEPVFLNQEEGRFPETRELRERLAARIEGAPQPRHASAPAVPRD
ncbi:MAG: Rdx family protein [Dehalococcoidia bacterium]